MNLTCNRMMATFGENAPLYGNCTTLADSLSYAWCSVFTRGSDALAAAEWLRTNVIGISPIREISEQSPAWRETAEDVPHNRPDPADERDDTDYDY